MNKEIFYSVQYNEHNWNDFVKKCEAVNEEVEGMPQDISRVLINTIGPETSRVWVYRHLHGLDQKAPINLVRTSSGTKALKAFILRMQGIY